MLLNLNSWSNTKVIVLNTEIPNTAEALKVINDAAVRICADGGLDRYFEHSKIYALPHAVVGDLDSVSLTALDRATVLGVDVVRIQDQNHTDLDKAFEFLRSRFTPDPTSGVVIVGDVVSTARFDHTMAALGTLKRSLPHFGTICVLGANETHIVIPSGECTILLPGRFTGSTCGLLPVFGPVGSATTEGFKWNLVEERLEVGGLVSSSNVIVSQTIRVTSSSELLFTICRVF